MTQLLNFQVFGKHVAIVVSVCAVTRNWPVPRFGCAGVEVVTVKEAAERLQFP